MDTNEMTTEELRAALAAREQNREDITARYMNRPAAILAPKSKPNPAICMVEFEGREYPVDMARLHGREFLTFATNAQGKTDDASTQLRMMELAFQGETDAAVCAAVVEDMGYEDYLEVLRREAGILEAANVKN